MRISLFLLILLVCTTPLFSQEKIATYAIGWRGKHVDIQSISDKAGKDHCLFVAGPDSIKGILLDDKQQIKRIFGLYRFPKERVVGGFIRDERVYLCCYNETDKGFHVWRTPDGDERPMENFFANELQNEKEVGRINAGDHFVYFTINKKTKEFVLYDFRNEQGFDSARYHFDDSAWKGLSEGNGHFGRDANVRLVDLEGECGVESAQCPNKLYLVRDSVFLLTNSDKGITGVYSFDIAHKQMNFRQIRHNDRSAEVGSIESYEDNSFLLDGKLYFVAVRPDNLNVQVCDFYSGLMLTQFTAGRDESITFKNGPIIQEGGAYSATAIRELDKTKQLIRKMLNGRAVIVAAADSTGRVTLTVGSYTLMKSSSGPSFTPGAGALSGVTFMAGGMFTRSWGKSARFQMLLDENTLKHMDGDALQGVNEKIAEYTKGMSIPSGGDDVFGHRGNYFYTYYDKDGRTLVLLAF